MSPISGTHLRLPCFGFSLTNTIFERAQDFILPRELLRHKKTLIQGYVIQWSE